MTSSTRQFLVVGLVVALCGVLTTSAFAVGDTARLSGYVFLDGPASATPPYDQANGMWDASDLGFSGVTLRARLHYLDSLGQPQTADFADGTWNVPNPSSYQAVTNASGYYQIDVMRFEFLRFYFGIPEPLSWEVAIVDEGNNALGLRPNIPTMLVSTTGHDEESGAILSRHPQTVKKFVYNSITMPFGSAVFNWPTGQFPDYTDFMVPWWSKTPMEWSASELTEFAAIQSWYAAATPVSPAGYFWRTHVDFGFAPESQELYPKCKLGDYVWVDTNKNGLQDETGTGVANVQVKLYNDSNVLMGTQSTGSDGKYLFIDLNAGNYRVEFTLPTGYAWTSQDQGADNAVDSDVDADGKTVLTFLAWGATDLTWDAGLVELPAAIGNYVWEDLNKDGLQDSGEPGVAGVTVNLKDAGGNVIDTMQTDANGLYLFDELACGGYSVSFVLPAGYAWTTQGAGDDAADSDADANGNAELTTLERGETDLTWDAGVVKLLAAIGDYVWLDANENGLQDDDETGVEGVTVNLKDAGGTVIDTMQTDANGLYLFSGLEPGDYSVSFVLPDGYAWTAKDAGDDAADSDADANGDAAQTTLEGGETDLTWDAGLVEDQDEEITVVKSGGKKGCPGATPALGDDMEFFITVTSNLNSPRDIEVRDYLDTCLQFKSATSGGVYVSNGHYVKWALTLPAGAATTTVSLVAKIISAPKGDNGEPASGDWIVSNEIEFEVWDRVYANAEGQYVPTSGAATGAATVTFANATDAGVYRFTCHPYPTPLTNKAYVGDREPPDESITVRKSGGLMAGDCHTIGFWKNNILKAIQGKTCGTQVTKAQLINWLGAVRNFYLANPYQNLIPASPDSAMLQAAYNVLDYGGSDMRQKLLKQLLATELNLVSGDYAMDDVAAHAAFCAAAEDALNTSGANLGAFHDMADRINNLGNTSDSKLNVGDRVVFAVTVEANLAQARSVEVRDYIDSCLTVETISDGGQYVSTGKYVKWNLTLPAGEGSKTVMFIAKVNSLPKNDNGNPGSSEWVLSNEVKLDVYSSSYASAEGVVEFTCYTPPTCTKKTLRNIAYAKPGDPTDPGDPGDPGTPPAEPKVTICKVADAAEVMVGEYLTYGIKVTVENGPATVTVWDDLSSSLSYVKSTPSGKFDRSKNRVTWENVALNTGDHYFLIKVKVKSGRCADEGALDKDSASDVDFACHSGCGGKKKQYIGSICNVAKVKLGCKTISSNKVITKIYKYTSRHWGC